MSNWHPKKPNMLNLIGRFTQSTLRVRPATNKWYQSSPDLYARMLPMVDELKETIASSVISGDYGPVYPIMLKLVRRYLYKYQLVDMGEFEEVSYHVAEEYVMWLHTGRITGIEHWLRYFDYTMIRCLVNYRHTVWTNPQLGSFTRPELVGPVRRMFTGGSLSLQHDRYKAHLDNMDILSHIDRYVDLVLEEYGRYQNYTVKYRHVRTSVVLTMISYPKIRLFKLDYCMQPYIRLLAEKLYSVIWHDICSPRYTSDILERGVSYELNPYIAGYYVRDDG